MGRKRKTPTQPLQTEPVQPDPVQQQQPEPVQPEPVLQPEPVKEEEELVNQSEDQTMNDAEDNHEEAQAQDIKQAQEFEEAQVQAQDEGEGEAEEEEDAEEEAEDDENAEEKPEGEAEDEEEEEVAEPEPEPIQTLLDPFTKEQLLTLLSTAAIQHADVLESIRALAEVDPTHRKIFVHGLGWDTTAEVLVSHFSKYGEIEDCKAVVDKATGKSKGYGFILFKTRSGARKALKEPQKKIGSRMTACQLASYGPVVNAPGGGGGKDAGVGGHGNNNNIVAASQPASEYTQKKIYVSNVSADIDPTKLLSFFSKYGEIAEGPLGIDKQTGKPKGFALFVYKNIESANKALEEPHKNYEGHILHCQKAIDGPKPSKGGQFGQGHHGGGQFGRGGGGGHRGAKFARKDHANNYPGGGHMYNQGGPAGPAGLNPVLAQALGAVLATQGGALGLGTLLGNQPGPSMGPGMQGGYGGGMPGGYGGQHGMPGGYGGPPIGPGGGRGQGGGHMGGGYMGH